VADAFPPWRIEPLVSSYVRSHFSCGHPSLDAYIKQYAGQNERIGISRTYVAVLPDNPVVLGYYSISASSVEIDTIPPNLRRRLPEYPIPVAHLGRLAVDGHSRGQRLGERLLTDALNRALLASQSIAIHAVEVFAIDGGARAFYLKYGFTPMLDDQHHLYLSLTELRKAASS
jgi:GNAT superfamily N-acetyltransferase